MAKETINLKEESRKDYTAQREGGNATSSDLQDGSLMRIADALERLAIGKTEVETQKDLEACRAQLSAGRRDYESIVASRDRLYRKISAYKGVITKLKKKIK